MLRTIKEYLKKFDYFLLLIMVLLAVMSFFAIYSAVYDQLLNAVQEHPYKQLKIFGAGLVVYVTIAFIGYRKIVRYAPFFYVIGCTLLVAVLLKGEVGMGAQRWLHIGPLKGQPSELFKAIWVMTLAWVFADLQDQRMGFFKLVKKFLWVIPPFILTYKQPDLGTALTYLASWGIVTLFLGVKRFIIAIGLIVALASMPLIWGHMKDYQRMRVITFIAPDKDPGGSGYQALQSRIAVGSGGLTGKGYLEGTQSHLRFMPERHTDFIFSVINEEFGFLGGCFIIVVFLILLLRILLIATQIKEPQGKVLCIAVWSILLFQFYINVSMTLGIAPIVGVPLPFISYGGSSLITFMCMLGFVNSVYICRNDSPA